MDLATAPYRGRFYGRRDEIETLIQILQRPGPPTARGVIALVGEAGIGKSRLALEAISYLEEETKTSYDVIMWRSLKEGLPVDRIMADLISTMSQGQQGSTGTAESDLATIANLANKIRVLLVLDNIESIIMPGVLAGRVMEEFRAYISLINIFAQTNNRCSVLITGRELPSEIILWEQESGQKSFVNIVRLHGLDAEASREILAASEPPVLSGSVATLMRALSYNPMKLRIAGPLIAEIYSGSVADFLERNTTISGELGEIVASQLERISLLESTILFWLALERVPVNADALIDNILHPPAKSEIGTALGSLIRRNLCERTQSGLFTLQPAVAEYLTSRLIEQIASEVNDGRIDLLNSFSLYTTKSPEYINKAQILYVINPLIERLSQLSSRAEIPRTLQALCSNLPDKTPGYLAGNVVNIFSVLNVSPIGEMLVGCEIRNADLRLFDLRGADLRRAHFVSCRFSTRLGNIHTCAVTSLNRELAVAGTSGDISLMRARDMVKVATLRGHVDWVRAVDVHPTFPHLISASDDGTLRVWDLSAGAEIARMRGHRGRIVGAAIGQRGSTILSIGEDGFLKEWNYSSWALQRTMRIQQEPLIDIAVSHDGSIIVLAGETNQIKILDGTTWSELATLSGHTEWVTTVTVSRNNQLLVSGSLDSSVRLWDLSQMSQISLLPGPAERVWSVAISNDSNEVAAGYNSGIVMHWQLQKGASGELLTDQTRTLRSHQSRVWSVLFLPSDHQLVSCGEGQAIRVWDVQSGECISSSEASESQMCSIDAISVDNHSTGQTLIATGGEDHQVRTWYWSSRGIERDAILVGHEGRVWSVLTADEQRLFTASEDGTVREWTRQNGDWHSRITIDIHRQIYNMEWIDRDRCILAVADEGSRIIIVDGNTGDVLSTLLGHDGLVWTVCVSDSGRHLASASFDGTVGWWDLQSARMQQRFRLDGAPMLGVVVPGAERTILSADYSGTVAVWDVSRGSLKYSFMAHDAPIWGISLSPSGEVLATGASDGVISLWKLANASLERRLQGHEQWLGRVRFYGDRTLLSVSTDGSARVWNVDTGECLAILRPPRVYEGLNLRGCSGLSDDDIAVFNHLGALTDQRLKRPE
jgi:WD40 repeat protein